MSKKKKTKNNQQNTPSAVEKSLDEKVLAREIIKAHAEYELHKKAEEEKKEQKLQEEWLKILDQKEYPKDEKWYLQKYHEFRNDFFLLKNLLFIKAKDVRDMRATFGLMRLAVISILAICKWILYLCAASMIYGIWDEAIDLPLGVMFAFVLWVFARIFRIASFEMEKMKDGNLLTAIFSGVLSFVAVVIAIVAIVIDKV